jgi:hypothetical protein
VSDPCGSKDEIHKISESVAVTKNRVTTMEQYRVADKQILDTFMGEMRSVIRTLENFLVEGREQLRQGDKKFELLFQSKRDLVARINEVEAHAENDLKTCAAACVVRHSEFVEKEFKPMKDQVKVLQNDKTIRDTKGSIIKNLPAIIAGLALLAAFWDKLVHLFSVSK